MKLQIVLISVLIPGNLAFSAQTLREIAWPAPHAEKQPENGEVVAVKGQSFSQCLKVENAQSKQQTLSLLVLDRPTIQTATYALTGRIRYEGVSGKGYLEMLSQFGGSGPYFSRTLSPSGPAMPLQGSSDWRQFVTPFHITNPTERPTRLTLNVVLPGPGTVWLGPIKLIQYDEGENPLALSGQWWGERTGGLIGAILGVTLGGLGGLVGGLCAKGRGKGVVLATLKAMFIFGLILLVLGIVALFRSQPYGVYYPLLLCGGLCTFLPLGLHRNIIKRFEVRELQKIKAMDVA